jgi:hypothetical protein
VPPLSSVIDELTEFVAENRDLDFKRAVKVTTLTDADFRRRVERWGEDDGPAGDDNDYEDVWRALGLIAPGYDLGAGEADFAEEMVEGFYDDETEELVIRGVLATPYARSVLVHELTHALQDQHFGLSRPKLYERDDESGLAFSALAEGDAELVRYTYYDSLTEAERKSLEDAEDSASDSPGLDELPRALLAYEFFPYQAGPDYVYQLYETGDLDAVDAAYRKPPTTTEQILHPKRRGVKAAPRKVAEPPAGGKVFNRGVAGELGIQLVLDELLDEATAKAAADGWGGDRYVAWRTGKRTCVRTRIVMDDARETRELVKALRSYVTERSGATVVVEERGLAGAVLLTTCG